MYISLYSTVLGSPVNNSNTTTGSIESIAVSDGTANTAGDQTDTLPAVAATRSVLLVTVLPPSV